MPAKLVKGRIFEKIDDWVNDPAATPAARAAIALNQLPNHPLLHVLTHLVPPINLTPAEKKHLRDDWFDEVKGWWPALQPIELIMKRGLIEALELVQLGGIGNTGRPIDTYWMCAGSEFEVYVTEGSTTLAKSRQITMIVSTPPPPASAAGMPLNRDEPILVVSRAMSLGATPYGQGFDAATGILTERPRVA